MKPYYLFILSAIILVTLGQGCATSKDVEQVRDQVSSARGDIRTLQGRVDEVGFSGAKRDKDLMARLDNMEKEQATAAESLKGLSDDVAVIKRNQADLGSKMFTMSGGEITGLAGQIEELKHEMETTNAKLDTIKATMLQQIADLEKALTEKLQAAQPQAGEAKQGETKQGETKQGEAPQGEKPEAKPAVPAGDPIQMYQSAYLDYTKGNYDLAVMGFREFLKTFPDAEYAGNAQYWIGESLYSLGRYEEALPEFDKVITGYPDSPKVPGAMLKKGYCYDGLKRPEEAKAEFEVLIAKYPGSEAAKLAAERLKPKTRGKKTRGK